MPRVTGVGLGSYAPCKRRHTYSSSVVQDKHVSSMEISFRGEMIAAASSIPRSALAPKHPVYEV
jgi:hypothetical protein